MSATARNGAIGRERNSAQEQQEEHPKVDPISVHSDFEVDTADNDGDQRKQAKTAADDRAACRRTIDEHEVVEKLAAGHGGTDDPEQEPSLQRGSCLSTQ